MPPPEAANLDDLSVHQALDFDALKRRGLELAQSLSGAHWTDYNLHDPGVTILEQVCYALTDLAYRAEFDVADHLTDDQGRLDYDALALRAPERIFPSRPATATDYRGAILDAVDGVENVWLRPTGRAPGDSAIPGLYRIVVRPRSGIEGEALAALLGGVRDAYLQARNLCEDVESVSLVNEVACVLRAQVEVQRYRDPAEVLAAVYHRCARFIAGDVRLQPFELARRQGLSLEAVFTGPLGEHGYWEDAALVRDRQTFEVPEFYGLVKDLDGVDYVHALHFEIDGRVCTDTLAAGSPDAALRLHIPGSPDEMGVTLISQGREVPVSLADFQGRYDEQALEALAAGRASQDPSKLYSLPSGVFRDLGRYPSIQNQFPAVYGITAQGLAENAPREQKARALQLRGYLLLFDQIMANFTANAAALRELFAARRGPARSYASQALDTTSTPDLDRLYPEAPESALAELVARFDDFGERKGRLLDYLLALYGEQFTQHSLRDFALDATQAEKEAALLDNKVEFLKAVAALGRDRGAGARHGRVEAGAACGLQRRVGHLLGLRGPGSSTLTAAFTGGRLTGIITDDTDGTDWGSVDLDLVEGERICAPDGLGGGQVTLQAPGDGTEAESLTALQERYGSLLPLEGGRIRGELLRRGVVLGHYLLGHLAGSDAWQLFLGLGDGRRWCRLGAFERRSQAVEAANGLRRLMVRLNRDSEGLHVLEHLLLRPRGGSGATKPDFYAFRLCVVFPAWTARFAEPGFRQLAEDTVHQNCPAHVRPAFMWLELEAMRAFERLHAQWLDRLGRPDGDPGMLNDVARQLRDFLAEHGS